MSRVQDERWLQSLFHGYLTHTPDHLDIGFELDVPERRQSDRSALSLSIHPLRFADDIFFSFRTNDDALAKRLRRYEVNYDLFYAYADLARATYLKTVKKNGILAENALLLVGQTERDRVIFDGERYLSLIDFVEQIASIAAQYDAVYFKPHPYARNSRTVFRMLKRRLGKVEITHDNIYHLLSNDRLGHVAGLNSSVLYETEYFRKGVTFFHKQSFDFDTKDIGIYGDYWNASFWADLFGTEARGVSLPFVPNRLRKALNDFWGYNEISDEIILKDIVKSKVKFFLSRYIR